MIPSFKSIAFLLAAIVLAGAGCSKLRNEHSSGGVGPGGGAGNSNNAQSSSGPPASAAAGRPTTWEANATSLNGADGETLTLACSPGGQPRSVWGSDIYTSDSSVCTAAVHSGLITFQQGGTVTVELRTGRDLYGCSERNGVISSCYGSWQHSFVFKAQNYEAVLRAADGPTPVLWNCSATMAGFEAGKTLKFSCPAGGK